MKNLSSIIFLLVLVVSCAKKQNQQSSLENQTLPLTDNSNISTFSFPFVVDSIDGYSIHSNGKHIEVFKEKEEILDASACSIDDYYFRWAKELDSNDIRRGFAMARALTGPSVGDADGCHTNYSINSIYEYRNKLNTRCFRIRIKGIDFCDGEVIDTSYYQGYFVDISRGENYKVIQIPAGLDFLKDKKLSEVSKMLANNIRISR